MSVYFVQPAGGGHIKIGVSNRIEKRHTQLRSLFPYGIDILAVIEGDRLTEGFLHCCFRPIATRQEWFRSEPAIWRLLIDIEDMGRPPFLPMKGDLRITTEQYLARAESEFGTIANAMKIMGYSPGSTPNYSFGMSQAGGGGGPARLAFAIAMKRGLIPTYIEALHQPEPVEAAA